MAKREPITQEYLRSILDYDPETGNWTWKRRPLSHFKTQRACSTWNSKWAGKVAGTVNKGGYVTINIFGIPRYAHRLAFLYMKGYMPPYVDHDDRHRGNNRWRNLRVATNGLNIANAEKRRDNKSGFKGVCWYPPLSSWHAQIHKDGRRIHLGYFKKKKDAVAVYQNKAKELFGEFACFD